MRSPFGTSSLAVVALAVALAVALCAGAVIGSCVAGAPAGASAPASAPASRAANQLAGAVTLEADVVQTAVSWATLEAVALHAVSTLRGDGPLTTDFPPSPVLESTVVISGKVVGISQRTVVADGGSGTVVVQMALLGDEQLVVDEMSPAGRFQGAALVFAPGSGAVESSVPLPGSSATATFGAAMVRAGPATVPGCYGDPQSPTVVGSVFGPLVQGEAVVACLSAEPLALIASIYQGGSQVGGTAGGTGTGNYLAVNAYAPCTVIPGTHTFQLAELYSVYGALQGGDVSATSSLHCS
ncbi:MAG: hypothetical protein ACYDHU_06250 [Acidimicrobiales bacterium]